jgi:hypothetical protein
MSSQIIDNTFFNPDSFFLLRAELSLRKFLNETRQSAANSTFIILWWIFLIAIICVVITIMPFLLPFVIYIRITRNKRIQLFKEKDPIFLKRISAMKTKELRAIEAELISLKELIDIFSDGEGTYVVDKNKHKEFYVVAEFLEHSLMAIKKRKTINLGNSISEEELSKYAKRIESLRDLWDDEY